MEDGEWQGLFLNARALKEWAAAEIIRLSPIKVF